MPGVYVPMCFIVHAVFGGTWTDSLSLVTWLGLYKPKTKIFRTIAKKGL